jgi:hypothetical protein
MRELFRMTREECPACHQANVNVARIDPPSVSTPRDPVPSELWAWGTAQ